MSAASPFGQPAFDICSAAATDSLDAPARNNDTHPSSHVPQCAFCFVAAQCASHPAMVGDAKVFPAFAVRDAGASPFVSDQDGAFAGRLHRTTGDPRGPPPLSA